MIDVSNFATKLRKVTRDPDMVRRFALEQARRRYAQYQNWRTFSGPRSRMLAAAVARPPVPVPTEGPYGIHTLVGVGGLQDSLFTLKRLYALLPDPAPLTFHEDGSFGPSHVGLVQRHFPGARVIRRADADREVLGELKSRSLPHCEAFRRRSVMGLKLFDLQWYAAGRRAWYIDTDVAFFAPPTEILNALGQPGDAFIDRYNEDVDTFYTWSPAQIESAVGIQYPERPVNAGMVVLHRPTLRWDILNACLALPEHTFYDEQTLWAVDFGAGRAAALAPEYDVCFRYAWEGLDRGACEREMLPGRPVTSEHFCGGFTYRRMFYDRMLRQPTV